jgi:hypothetical protein
LRAERRRALRVRHPPPRSAIRTRTPPRPPCPGQGAPFPGDDDRVHSESDAAESFIHAEAPERRQGFRADLSGVLVVVVIWQRVHGLTSLIVMPSMASVSM